MTKKYLAVVHGRPRSGQQAGGWQELRSYLRKNDRLRRVESFERPVRDAQEAWLEFRVLRTARNWSLVEIDLKTGRKHQIRAQFSDAGHPIYGDRKYDSAERMGKQIALHAKSLTIQHPTLKTRMDFEAPLPENWGTYGKIVPLLAGF